VNLLLDTHIWLWSLLQPDRLTARVTKAIGSPDSDLWLSPLSIWEVLVLVERGRIQLRSGVESWVSQALARVPMREAPVTREVALETRRVQLSHGDPVDRFLAATARVFDLTLVTADERLLAAKGLSVLPNR
jgi:PIN domain nuclease of toxin-antitoxin system